MSGFLATKQPWKFVEGKKKSEHVSLFASIYVWARGWAPHGKCAQWAALLVQIVDLAIYKMLYS